jgi:hypothetical protein
MPLPIKKPFGLTFVYKPFFIQKLGIFSQHELTEPIFSLFFQNVINRYWYLKFGLQIPDFDFKTNLSIRKRTNYILSINKPYNEIIRGYSTDARKSLKKKTGISITFDKNFEFAIRNYTLAYSKMAGLKEKNYLLFAEAIRKADQLDKVIGATVYKDEQQIGSGLFLVDNRRAYYVLGAPTPEGRRNNATHFLIDGFIAEFAEKLDVLDFEGSDIESVAYFYQKWGSVDETYYDLKGGKYSIINLFFQAKDYIRSITSR